MFSEQTVGYCWFLKLKTKSVIPSYSLKIMWFKLFKSCVLLPHIKHYVLVITFIFAVEFAELKSAKNECEKSNHFWKLQIDSLKVGNILES